MTNSKGSKLYVVEVFGVVLDEYFVVRADDRATAIARASQKYDRNEAIRRITIHEATEI